MSEPALNGTVVPSEHGSIDAARLAVVEPVEPPLPAGMAQYPAKCCDRSERGFAIDAAARQL
jgi:hypothetical protein